MVTKRAEHVKEDVPFRDKVAEANPFLEGVPPPEDPDNLPPIHHIKPPDMQHMSTKIRWYLGLGYKVKEVSKFLGVLYQQVRNVSTTVPKRAMREDIPPLLIILWEVDDDLEAMDAHAMEVEMMAQRGQDRSAKKRLNAERRALRDTVDPDEGEFEQDEDEGGNLND